MDHYSDYCYAHLMRGTSAENKFWAKEAYERLAATYEEKVCAYKADNGRFPDPLFKD